MLLGSARAVSAVFGKDLVFVFIHIQQVISMPANVSMQQLPLPAAIRIV
jgi:hypothetical protein